MESSQSRNEPVNDRGRGNSAPESLRTRFERYYFNFFFTCYRRTGVRILHIADDYKEVRVALPLNRKTRGYFGTLFGGSIYGAVDPVLMVMLNRILGREYVVWDKAARVQFLKPGRSTLYADFKVTDAEVAGIIADVQESEKTERTYEVALVDAQGVPHAVVEKTLHIRARRKGNEVQS